MTSCQRTLRWSVTTCRKARDVAIATKPTLLRARVEGHTTRAVAEAGASCVRLQLMDAPLCHGGWLIGLRSPTADEDGFVPAIGGAPGDHRHGLIDAIVFGEQCCTSMQEPDVTFLQEGALGRLLPVGAEVAVAPIWQCTDFFDLRRQFEDADTDGSGFIDAKELAQLLATSSSAGAALSDAEVAALLASVDTNGDGLISFEEFCATGFAATRLRARLHELAERAASRVRAMHDGPPWRGALVEEANGFEALVCGSGLDR